MFVPILADRIPWLAIWGVASTAGGKFPEMIAPEASNPDVIAKLAICTPPIAPAAIKAEVILWPAMCGVPTAPEAIFDEVTVPSPGVPAGGKPYTGVVPEP